ncbi:MAG TPA: hypothetical protein VMV69_19245 [Pirellulales bacterium]|nr:hypothetical protein [Pirellulales bacterium]
MEKNWVQPHLVFNLDATMHQTEVLRIRALVQQHSPQTIDALEAHVTKGTTPTTIGFDYQSAGIRFVRSQNVLSNSIIGEFTYISGDCDAAMNRSRVKCGDLLINLVGASIGRSAVYPFADSANINQAVGRIRFTKSEDEINPRYVASWINTSHAQALILAEQSGQARDNFDLHQLREFLIPSVAPMGQKYIGEKVRHAERLRAHAQGQKDAFDLAIAGSFPELASLHDGSAKHSRAPAARLGESLNPGEFTADRVRVRGYLHSRGGRLVGDVARIDTPIASTYGSDDIYIGLDSIGSTCGSISPSTIGKQAVVGAVRVLPEGPVISKLRPYLNKVAYIPSELSGSFASTELLCVRPNDEAHGWYLCGVLRLRSTVRQLNPVSTGSTHPRVSRGDVASVIVPWITDPSSAGLFLRQAQAASFAAEKLTTAAKLLVESLIDRRIGEADLIDAQHALDSGETGPDRAILARLTAEGIDVAGKPLLFPDIDAVYAALEEAKRANSADDGGGA